MSTPHTWAAIIPARQSPSLMPISQQQANSQRAINAVPTERRAWGAVLAVLTTVLAHRGVHFDTLAKHGALNSKEYAAVLFVLIKEFENSITGNQPVSVSQIPKKSANYLYWVTWPTTWNFSHMVCKSVFTQWVSSTWAQDWQSFTLPLLEKLVIFLYHQNCTNWVCSISEGLDKRK